MLAVGATTPDVIEVAVCLGTGGGFFAAATTFPTGSTSDGWRTLVVDDFDGDGIPDVAVAASGGLVNPASVLRGLGAGSFDAPALFMSGVLIAAVRLAVWLGHVIMGRGDGRSVL